MDRYAKLVQALQQAMPASPQPVFTATVKAVNDETCTVTYGELELEDVRLRPDVAGNTNKVLLYPKQGSTVLVGSLSGDLGQLVLLRVDELEKLSFKQDGLQIEADATTKKVTVKNDSTSLAQLLQDLVDLLKGFKVNTPSGPSAGVLPDTVAALTSFETSYKTLFS